MIETDGPFWMPPYLQMDSGSLPEESSQRTYGTLSYNKRRDCWVINAEPMMTELCKRLFPGCDNGKRGEARFPAHRRIIGELNWLMLRYPLTIREKDMERWENALSDARRYAFQREYAKSMPQYVSPDSSTFTGTLTEFQQEGLAFLLRSDRCLLADEMGLGKTVQALAMVAQLGIYPVLIVMPPHLTRNWQCEISRFLRKSDGTLPVVHTVHGLKPYELPQSDIYLMHYLLLRGWKEVLPDYRFPIVIFDEIQELRHSGTEKYSAASLLTHYSQRAIGLSGTPIYNHGAEIWNVINILDYHFLGDFDSFSREWCYGYGNQIVQKPDLLGEYLRGEGIMLRRVKQQVLPQLPPKRRLVIQIESDEGIYRRLTEPLLPLLRQLANVTEGTSPSEIALMQIEIEQGTRRATGLAKAPYVVQFVRALLDGGEKVLLFAHHHDVMDYYRKELHNYSPGFITGRESTAEKERSVERFMNGRSDLCCISLRAASGLNLQRASCIVFGELDWSPAVHSQAEDRAHRIGQTDSILCYYLVSSCGSDGEIQDALGLKVSQFVQLMGDEVPTQQETIVSSQFAREHVKQLIERLIREKSLQDQ